MGNVKKMNLLESFLVKICWASFYAKILISLAYAQSKVNLETTSTTLANDAQRIAGLIFSLAIIIFGIAFGLGLTSAPKWIVQVFMGVAVVMGGPTLIFLMIGAFK